MSHVLDKIVEKKHQEVAALLAEHSLEEWEKKARTRLDSVRGFRASLSSSPERPALIAEVKHRSPSVGTIWNNFDPVRIAKVYESAGARALSVLTDVEFFGGSAEHLMAVRAAVGLPILRKDFIVHPVQICEAAVMGADAVLLIARLFSPEELARLLSFAEDFGLDALVEVHSKSELDAALRCNAKTIGVNNRDLDTLEIDLRNTQRLLAEIPEGTLKVSESGLNGAADVQQVQSWGANCVLIGTAFGTDELSVESVRAVMGWA